MGICVQPWERTHEGRVINLPCGKCHECRKTRINGWAFRLEKEAESSDSAFFLTLTYKEPPLTKNNLMTINKRDVQLFMKKLRKINERKIKYYLCGEYGGKTKRPHYHLIIFNLDVTLNQLEKTWNLGQIHLGQLNSATVNYTLKYLSKLSTIPLFARDDRHKEFSLMSKGLGANYLTKNMIKYHQHNMHERFYIQKVGGQKIGLPRYYKEKLFTLEEREMVGEYLRNKAEHEFHTLSVEEKIEYIQNHHFHVKENQRKFEKLNNADKL